MPRVTARLAAVPSLMTKTNLLSPSGPVCTASSGTSKAFEARAAGNGGVDGRARLQRSFRILHPQPHLDRGASGIERGADERDFSRHRIGEPGEQ